MTILTNANARGIGWALISTGLFALTAALAKIAVTEFHVLQILLFRQIVVFLSCLPTLKAQSLSVLKTNHPWFHLARLIGAFTALSCGIWAVSVLPLTTVTTLGFVQVFFVLLLAALLLGEQMNRAKTASVFLGFIGVLIVIRPGVEGFASVYALIPILSAAGASVAVIAVRKLSQTEHTATLLVYQAVFVGLMAAVPMVWFWQTPTLKEALFLISMGILATGGQWIGILSLRLGEASVISNVSYISLIYAAILGYFLFREVPDVFTIVGALVIIGSAVLLLKRPKRSK